MVRNVTRPARSSVPTDEPRSRMWKKRSRASMGRRYRRPQRKRRGESLSPRPVLHPWQVRRWLLGDLTHAQPLEVHVRGAVPPEGGQGAAPGDGHGIHRAAAVGGVATNLAVVGDVV